MPFPQHVYDAAALALARGMSVERMRVLVPQLAGMPHKAVFQLAKKVEARGRVPGRHGVTAITCAKCENVEGPEETPALPPTLASPVTRTGSESSLSPSPSTPSTMRSPSVIPPRAPAYPAPRAWI